jgi:hypothetical protein
MAEVKKGKPIKVTRNEQGDFQTQHGMLYGFFVEMDNGDKGPYAAKDVNAPKFIVGQEIEYTVEVKEGVSEKTGATYRMVKLKPYSANSGSNWNGKKKVVTPEEQKCYCIRDLFLYRADMLIALESNGINSDPVIEESKTWIVMYLNDAIKDGQVQFTKLQPCRDALAYALKTLTYKCIKSKTTNSLTEFANIYNTTVKNLTPVVKNEETSNNN